MPVVSSFAGDSLLHQSGGFEPLRKSNFALVFYGLSDSDLLVLSLRSSSVPAWAVNKKGIKYFNETMHYAASMKPFDSQQIKYIDFVDRNVLKVLDEWRKYVWCEDTGSMGRAASYKKQGDIYLLPPGAGGGSCPGEVSATDGQRVWHLEGCWPESLKYGDLSMDDEGGPVEIELTISIDRAYPKS